MSDTTLYLRSLFNIERISGIIFYLCFLFFITIRQSILWELQCTLVGNQSKTELLITKVAQRSDFVVVTAGQVSRV
ncbi:hypothetical protein V1478_009701 [Vespula squamosa]|uniref:Uncharacterized protein n=1 Tax=Vespula squamosa TaxID=30214 RepID=A0ABD2AQE3_VESSQ